MLESYKHSKKKHRINFIELDNKNSYKELIDKDKKVINRKGTNKKKNKTMKGLKQLKLKLDNIKVKEERKTQFSQGDIKIAKIHREATRPLKQIKDLTKEEIKNNSCPCCGLPTKIKGKLEDYKMCDSPDEFNNCGEGVILYFSFIKFCIVVTFIATLGITFFNGYISYNYYSQLKIICDKLPIDEEDTTNCYYCSYFSDYEDILYDCEIYSQEKRLRRNSDHYPFTTLFDSIFFKTSLVIIIII